MREIEVNKIYQHFKGKLYLVKEIVFDSESNNDEVKKKIVVYQALYGEHLTWARPYDMFCSEVDHKRYPDVKEKYRFTEYKRDYEKEGLKVLLNSFNEDLKRCFEKLNMEVVLINKMDLSSIFKEMETSDFLVIEIQDSNVHPLIYVTYAYAHHIPVYFIAKKGENISKDIEFMSEKIIFYEQLEDIQNEFKQMIETNNLKTNPYTLIRKKL